jgi:hypothetical protein
MLRGRAVALVIRREGFDSAYFLFVHDYGLSRRDIWFLTRTRHMLSRRIRPPDSRSGGGIGVVIGDFNFVQGGCFRWTARLGARPPSLADAASAKPWERMNRGLTSFSLPETEFTFVAMSSIERQNESVLVSEDSRAFLKSVRHAAASDHIWVDVSCSTLPRVRSTGGSLSNLFTLAAAGTSDHVPIGIFLRSATFRRRTPGPRPVPTWLVRHPEFSQ